MKEKRILIIFPNEFLRYSTSVLNLHESFKDHNYTKLIYFADTDAEFEKSIQDSQKVKLGKLTSILFERTFGIEVYKIIKLFFVLLKIKLFGKKFDHIIAIDPVGYLPARILFSKTVYFSTHIEKDRYFKACQLLGIDKLIIQSKSRKDHLIGNDEFVEVFYLPNAPIIKSLPVIKATLNSHILYLGNIDYGNGLERFMDVLRDLDSKYTLTLKGKCNNQFYVYVTKTYDDLIKAGRLIFDLEYIDQSKIIEYVSNFCFAYSGYDSKNEEFHSKDRVLASSNKLNTYFAGGVPVIGVKLDGLESVTEFNAGILMEEVSFDNVKDAINKIELEYISFSENCLKAATEFNFKKGFDSFIQNVGENVPAKLNIKTFFTQGHKRSLQAKQHILASILIKCVSIVISFVLIPLTLNYLNPVKYGIWLTITSVISWFAFFDLGLGNGLRNKLAEALAKDDKELARTYISTSYAILTLIIGIVYILFMIAFPFINWSWILNTPPEMNGEINRLIFIVFSFFCLQFIIKLISMILKADQRPSISGGINTFASLLSLIIVFIITKTTEGSILWLSVGISAANIISPLVATIWFFSKDYKHLIPSFKYVNFKSAKDLMGLGFLFFIMQFAGLILFATDSFIIDQMYGPEEVTPYNIAFKYFSVITMGFTIITTPFWSAYTDAYHKKDFKWIKRITKKLSSLWLLLVAAVLFMLLFADFFYELWIGDKIKIPFILSLSMAMWILISTWTSIFGNFLSGVEKIRLSLYHSVIVIFLNVPLSIFLAKYLNLGSAGVIIATCICVLPQVVLHPLQYRKIIQNKATGIWNR